MSLREKLDVERLLNGALIAATIALAWKFDRPEPRPEPVVENYPSEWVADDEIGIVPSMAPGAEGAVWVPKWSWAWWKEVAVETTNAMSADRLLAVAAGVVFYALLAIFPAVTAFVSLYGLFADPAKVWDHLSGLTAVLPAGGISIIQEQVARLADKPSGLSVGFAVGLMIALWSANAGVKAMIDALNVIRGEDEKRGFFGLNVLSLTFTIGAVAFLLLAVGAVVAFPLVISMFGLKAFTDTATWLIRWPLLFALVIAALTLFYRFGPSPQVARRSWFTLGALVAGLAWLAGSAALSFYLSNFANYNATYGSLGAAIGLMMWMWLTAISVLLGAQIDCVIERISARQVSFPAPPM